MHFSDTSLYKPTPPARTHKNSAFQTRKGGFYFVNLLENQYNPGMRIIARSTLRQFWEIHADAEQPMKAWYDEASRAEWNSPTDIKSTYRNASIIANNRVVFNIKGNDYRLIVHVRYDIRIIFIRFVGTHSEYDNVDATTI